MSLTTTSTTSDGGTGTKFTYATTVVAGVASFAATLLSVVSIWLQTKNYRKPLLQRYVVRILLMVPIYSIASFTSMVSLNAAQFVDPIRDIYEAFTIYTFFQLLINYLGGERSLIIMTHGRAPVQHLWPMNHVLRKVDISDPHTFLSIKRGILQYAWLKPVLAIAAIVMKATGTYQEGYIGAKSGYFWSGIIYNISVTVSLYSLGLFWVCMHKDLTPFRPVPKFLCIKLIIFASYWQGFFLSILVWLGAIPDDVQGYTRDNLAAAIQDALICVEMPAFAIAHWYAFSWHDFADNSILSARMPLNHALKDSFGIKDLIEDSKETFRGNNYGYRAFDSGDKVMAHEDSKSRLARLNEGMRYERGGKAKYWLPKPGEVSATSPLLGGPSSSRTGDTLFEQQHGTFDEPELDEDEERLYNSARQLEYGDWNYPVITASEPLAERYRSSMSSYNGRSPAWSTGPTRPPPQTRASGSTSPRNPPPQQTAEPQPVVVVKKKKKAKKVVKHPEPDPADLGLGKGPPAASPAPPTTEASTSAQRPQADEARQWGDSAVDEEEHATSPRYQVEDSEEFRNVWDGDK
ncbi:organic solute transporter ostalpha [Pochonia chlamydosporia 170]|uniref:Organic solute transporter ostalpha n=1 Tax=Pochonia chlamydosporia 170 TaxID=1380566 RepID=A0A179G1M5_METCM|nr:organic solute transporter ostalpha [Pochonia chlamydosporia 170]OAQ71388.1 organic solute transporter ostalpha [Pochonia chlamydosporia 170]